jgi:hypothetical protein
MPSVRRTLQSAVILAEYKPAADARVLFAAHRGVELMLEPFRCSCQASHSSSPIRLFDGSAVLVNRMRSICVHS